eukprot:NODE_4093_length_497_cov_21.589286_g3497_i0.p1 GENE.NODE_4093_length_497_cov_21.589286_g3497_i0~~NODE_4093_length_497_cov_21.589286_g3497_i0.p1  ORF type:complete len:101 (-),score=4.74 NODE_4093_length_497_cov_21.589286_g3497_i0:170-472(-)
MWFVPPTSRGCPAPPQPDQVRRGLHPHPRPRGRCEGCQGYTVHPHTLTYTFLLISYAIIRRSPWARRMAVWQWGHGQDKFNDTRRILILGVGELVGSWVV